MEQKDDKEGFGTTDIDSQSTLLREVTKALYAKLNIIPKTHGFSCPYLEDCSRKSKESGTEFHTGNWVYVGLNYGTALIDGKHARILIVAMDRGGYGGVDEEEFTGIQREVRQATQNPINWHMGGVSLIVKELVDDKDSLVLQRHIYPIPLLTSPLKGEGLEKLP